MKKLYKATQKFDPIEFLEISGLEAAEKKGLRKKLEKNISEYLLIRLLEELPDTVNQKLINNQASDIEGLENMLKSYIPNFDSKIKQYLNEFKKQYQHE